MLPYRGKIDLTCQTIARLLLLSPPEPVEARRGLASRPATGENCAVQTRKIIKWSAIVVVLLLIVGGVVVIFAIDNIIRSRIEAQATQSMKLRTKLQSARLSLLHGTLGLNQLGIESPQGFA